MQKFYTNKSMLPFFQKYSKKHFKIVAVQTTQLCRYYKLIKLHIFTVNSQINKWVDDSIIIKDNFGT